MKRSPRSHPRPATPTCQANQRKDARQVGQAVEELDAGRLEFKLAARFPLTRAEAALARAIAGGGEAIALEL